MAVMPTMMGVAVPLGPNAEPTLPAVQAEINRMLREPRYRSWLRAHHGNRWVLADTARTRLLIRTQEDERD